MASIRPQGGNYRIEWKGRGVSSTRGITVTTCQIAEQVKALVERRNNSITPQQVAQQVRFLAGVVWDEYDEVAVSIVCDERVPMRLRGADRAEAVRRLVAKGMTIRDITELIRGSSFTTVQNIATRNGYKSTVLTATEDPATWRAWLPR
jgi:hypothetical protein